MTSNIFNVRKITLGKTKKLGSSYVREIVIESKTEEYTISLFSEELDDLAFLKGGDN